MLNQVLSGELLIVELSSESIRELSHNRGKRGREEVEKRGGETTKQHDRPKFDS